jgi:nucleotide-binding universal stress UspA family protein
MIFAYSKILVPYDGSRPSENALQQAIQIVNDLLACGSMVSGNASADTFLSTLFPKEGIKQHSDYIQKNFVFPIGIVSKEKSSASV